MTLAAYAAECRRLALELIGETTPGDIEQVRAELAGMEETDWLSWCAANQKEISLLISASPSKRRTRKSWRSVGLKPRYALAAIQHTIRGLAVLNAVENRGLHPGGSYRDMAARSGTAYMDLFFSTQVFYWPFEGPGPFEWVSISLDSPLD